MSTPSIPPFPEIPGVEFRHIPNFPGYAVSDDGAVWSCRSKTAKKFLAGWRRLKAHPTGRQGRGYLSVVLTGPVGVHRTMPVHTAILLTFVGPKPPGMQACHMDGNSRNNTPANLRWGTPKENRDDMHRHQTDSRGHRNSQCKVNEQTVRAIRARRSEGVLIRILCADYGLSRAQVKRIIARTSWAHV
jgi:hypothetical protein